MTRPPRLDPFAFVADTGLRFGLLVVFTVAAAARRWVAIGLDWGDPDQRAGHCLGARLGPALDDPLAAARWDLLQECLGLALSAAAPALALGLGLLAAATAGLYLVHPAWRIRRLRLRPLRAAEDAPGLGAELAALSRAAGLPCPPELWWNPLDGRVLAIAFGRPGRPRIGLSGGAAALFYADPAAFRVLLLHELAHIRNGDVGIAFLALSVWWAFLGTALLPGLVLAPVLARPALADAALLAADLVLVAAGVLLTRNAVLRARELHADARVIAWLPAEAAALSRAFAALRPIRGLRRLASPHPDPARRRRLLESTDAMFRFGGWDAFGTGFAAAQGMILCFLASTVAVVLAAGGVTAETGLRAALLSFASFALPAMAAAAVVSIVTWRACFAALLRGRSAAAGTARTACALAAGAVMGGPGPYLAGMIVGLGGGIPGLVPPELGLGPLAAGALGVAVALVLGLAAMLVPFLRWVEAGATAWLAEALRGERPGPSFWIGIGVSSALAAPWLAGLGPVLAAVVLGTILKAGPAGLVAAHVYLGAAGGIFPINLVSWGCLVWLWAFPMAAALAGRWRRARGGRGGLAAWPFLDPVPAGGGPAPPASPLRPERALLVGLGCGLLAAAAMGWLRVPVPVEAARALGAPAPEAYARFLSVTLTAVAAQGLAGAAAALAVPRLGVVHGLFAGSVAGAVLVPGATLWLRAEGVGPPGVELARLMVSSVLLSGWVAAVVGAAAGAGVRRVVGRGG